jgi:hypothetical protein
MLEEVQVTQLLDLRVVNRVFPRRLPPKMEFQNAASRMVSVGWLRSSYLVAVILFYLFDRRGQPRPPTKSDICDRHLDRCDIGNGARG